MMESLRSRDLRYAIRIVAGTLDLFHIFLFSLARARRIAYHAVGSHALNTPVTYLYLSGLMQWCTFQMEKELRKTSNFGAGDYDFHRKRLFKHIGVK